MHWSYWSFDHTGHLIILVIWSYWSFDHIGHLIILVIWPYWSFDHIGHLTILVIWSYWSFDHTGHLIILVIWPYWSKCIGIVVIQPFRCFHAKHPLFSCLIWHQIKRIITLAGIVLPPQKLQSALSSSLYQQSGIASDHQQGSDENIRLEVRL